MKPIDRPLYLKRIEPMYQNYYWCTSIWKKLFIIDD